MSLFPPKLQFPQITTLAFTAWLSDVRMTLQDLAVWCDVPSLATQIIARKAAMAAQVTTLMNFLSVATLANAGTIAIGLIKNSVSTKSTVGVATATVSAAGAITAINLGATDALVPTGDSIPAGIIKNSGSTKQTGAAATATVAAGIISAINLGATDTVVPTGMTLAGVAPTGSYTTTVTFTVAGGVITAIALS